jgi:ABC-type sugar transport system ATPase subunit
LLFPNRTVRENIAFGLEVRHLNRRARDAAVEQIASKLSISHLLQRRPETLSAGERQKVSLARALVLRPPVLLLDEPISAVDEKTRDNLLCRELRAIQRDSGITTVHVAHNRQEIELVADRVGYLEAGRLRDIVEIAPGDIRLKPRGAEDG